MQVAQRLYEGTDIGGETVGLITYMRTDGVQIAPEAVNAARRVIAQEYGERYLPEKPRFYSTKAKNAQEAHEAIRPTDLARLPNTVARYLEADEARLTNSSGSAPSRARCRAPTSSAPPSTSPRRAAALPPASVPPARC
jgi:DNA topoisomerase I (EC 5.99.1.2)